MIPFPLSVVYILIHFHILENASYETKDRKLCIVRSSSILKWLPVILLHTQRHLYSAFSRRKKWFLQSKTVMRKQASEFCCI
jgi:hypothetical protein